MAMPMVSSATGVAFGGFQRRVASFRVTGMARHSNVFRNLSKVVLCGRRNALQFSWQAQHFGRVHLHFAWQRSTLKEPCCVVFVNRIGRAASSGDKVQIPWQAWHFVRCAES